MKSILFAFSLMVSSLLASNTAFANQSTDPTYFPKWVTDDRAKVWVVSKFLELMKNKEFYKIESVVIKRVDYAENNCDALTATLTYEELNCPNQKQEIAISTYAPLCNDTSCGLFVVLKSCKSDMAFTINAIK